MNSCASISALMNNEIKNDLKKLGLSDKEIRVYANLINSKPLNISELSKATGIKRTGLYYILPGLLKRGLAQKVVLGKRFYYSASELDSYADNLLSAGARIKKYASKIINYKKEFSVEVATQKEQLADLINKTLQLKKGEIIRSIESPQSIEIIGNNFVGTSKYWQKLCGEKGIVLKGVGMESSLKNLLDMWPKEVLKNMTNRSVSPKIINDNDLPNFKISIIAYEDTTLIFLLQNNIAISIKNQDISDSFKDLIDSVYSQGRYVNLNEKIMNKVEEKN